VHRETINGRPSQTTSCLRALYRRRGALLAAACRCIAHLCEPSAASAVLLCYPLLSAPLTASQPVSARRRPPWKASAVCVEPSSFPAFQLSMLVALGAQPWCGLSGGDCVRCAAFFVGSAAATMSSDRHTGPCAHGTDTSRRPAPKITHCALEHAVSAPYSSAPAIAAALWHPAKVRFSLSARAVGSQWPAPWTGCTSFGGKLGTGALPAPLLADAAKAEAPPSRPQIRRHADSSTASSDISPCRAARSPTALCQSPAAEELRNKETDITR
jgi:hypothetical protein